MVGVVDTKQCATCGQHFVITKHQKTKRYCSAVCSDGWTKKRTNKATYKIGGKYGR